MELPEEIIVEILKFSWKNDKKSFETMAATCKLIRRISHGRQFTNCFKCPNCDMLESALKEDHLTCYKWSYNRVIKPDIDQLCIDASNSGSLKIVKFLVSLGANIHAYQNRDQAVRYASFHGHLEVVKFLVSVGANIHANYDHAVIAASEKGHFGSD